MFYFQVITTCHITTDVDDLTLWLLVPAVSRWLWPGNRTFLEVASIVVTWWIVAFHPVVGCICNPKVGSLATSRTLHKENILWFAKIWAFSNIHVPIWWYGLHWIVVCIKTHLSERYKLITWFQGASHSIASMVAYLIWGNVHVPVQKISMEHPVKVRTRFCKL